MVSEAEVWMDVYKSVNAGGGVAGVVKQWEAGGSNENGEHLGNKCRRGCSLWISSSNIKLAINAHWKWEMSHDQESLIHYTAVDDWAKMF